MARSTPSRRRNFPGLNWLTKKKLTHSASASTKAFKAGQKSGDTAGFDLWLTRQRLGEISSSLRKKLEERYRDGVERGEEKSHKRDDRKAELQKRKDRLEDLRYQRDLKRLEKEVAKADKIEKRAEQTIEKAAVRESRGTMSEAQFAAIKARMEREIEAQEQHKAAILAKNPGCAATRRTKITDRAQRYRANQKGCRPTGLKKCKLCSARSDVMVDHVDGDESNGRKANLRWLCRSCNTLLGAEMARTGQGRRTVQYNPAHRGAQTLGEYMQAVLQHTRGVHDDGGRIIHETPKSKRQAFASEIWAARKAHGNPAASGAQYRLAQAVLSGTARETHMSREVAREIVDRTPAQLRSEHMLNPDASFYSLAIFDGVSLLGGKQDFTALTLAVAQGKAQAYADDMGYDSVLYDSAGKSLGRFTTARAIRPGQTRPAGLANPDNGAEEYRQAKKIAELFHGRPVKEEITAVTEQIREHDWLWRIGPLVKLKIRTVRKQNATFPFSLNNDAMVHLFCSPDGRQFYLRGGDTEIDLKPLGMAGSDWFRDKMVIGEVKEITYEDRKKFHSFKATHYFHRLGEVSKVKPWMIYDTMNHKIEIVGGQYYVETKELVEGMSPGVVN